MYSPRGLRELRRLFSDFCVETINLNFLKFVIFDIAGSTDRGNRRTLFPFCF